MIGGLSHPDHLVAFDLETTGLSPKSDRILEIGAVRYDRALRPIGELQVVVDPQMPIPLAIQRLVGLTDDDVIGAPSPGEACAAQLDAFCGDAALIAHGGTFDLLFLRALLSEDFGSRLIYDTLDLARILLPTYESHSLPLLSRRLGITHERPHRALSDARATGDLFRVLVGAGRGLPESTREEMRRVASQAPGPLQAFLGDILVRPDVDAYATGRQQATYQLSCYVREQRPAASGERRSVGETAAALLGPDGPLAMSDGYEYRDAQVQMAMAVGQTLERKRRLMVEAGTGVGKSLAYLVPLALWAREPASVPSSQRTRSTSRNSSPTATSPPWRGSSDEPVPWPCSRDAITI